MDGVAITATLVGVGGLVTLFIKYIEGRDKAQDKRDQIFAAALATNTAAMQAVATSTNKSAREAKERNGHLAELAIENNKNNQDHNAHVTELLARIDTTSNNSAHINAKALELLEQTATTLKVNTDTNREATKQVASALITAAEKVAAQPVHIDQQTVDHQTVGESTNR
jgi:hypothetical protein